MELKISHGLILFGGVGLNITPKSVKITTKGVGITPLGVELTKHKFNTGVKCMVWSGGVILTPQFLQCICRLLIKVSIFLKTSVKQY